MGGTVASRRASPLVVAVVLLVATVAFVVPGVPLAGAVDPAFTITPTSGLVDGQDVAVAASGLETGVTYVIVECGPQAVTIISGGWPDGDINPEDGCDAQSAVVRFTGDGSTMSATTQVHVLLNAAVGPIDCRSDQCFIALFPLAGSAPLHIQNLTFGADACDGAGSCVPGTRPGIAGAPTPRPARPTPAPPVQASATASSPAVAAVAAGVAGDLTGPDAITGEVTGAFATPDVPVSPVTGEGIIRLDLAAPGTDWGANIPSSIVADVRVDGGTPQQLVLFNGATPFVYAGGLGELTTGTHTVSISVNTVLSHPGSAPARIDVHDLALTVVDETNPQYETIHHAPVLYGRSTSALHDTPLLEYGSTSPSGSGTSSSYTMVFSHENSGTAFVPFMESAVWGRTTDIESFFTATFDATGVPTGGHFLSGATPDDYPDTQNAIDEPTVAYTSGAWEGGTHGVVRVATGNNDFSQNGSTPFRFRPVPVPAPGPGRPREAAMDQHPWTYRIAGEEVARWYTNFTTDPLLPEQGDARQYAYVQLDSSGTGVDKLAIDVQLDGGPTWYANDLGSGYATGGTGIDRTVIKLPTDWLAHAITAVRIRVFPASATSSLQVQDLQIFGLDADWGFHRLSLPPPSIVDGFLFVPVAAPTSTTTSTTAPASTTMTTPSTSTPPASTTSTLSSASTSTTLPGAPSTTVAGSSTSSGPTSTSTPTAPAPPTPRAAQPVVATPTYTG